MVAYWCSPFCLLSDFLLGQVRTHVLWPPGLCPPAGHFQYIPARCWMFWTFMIYIRSCEKADLGMNRIENGTCAPRYAALVDVSICPLCCICQRVTCCEYRLVKNCHIWWRCGTICQWQPSPTATDILLACSLASICQVPKMNFFFKIFSTAKTFVQVLPEHHRSPANSHIKSTWYPDTPGYPDATAKTTEPVRSWISSSVLWPWVVSALVLELLMIVRIPNRYPRRVWGGFQVQGIPRCFLFQMCVWGFNACFQLIFWCWSLKVQEIVLRECLDWSDR